MLHLARGENKYNYSGEEKKLKKKAEEKRNEELQTLVTGGDDICLGAVIVSAAALGGAWEGLAGLQAFTFLIANLPPEPAWP